MHEIGVAFGFHQHVLSAACSRAQYAPELDVRGFYIAQGCDEVGKLGEGIGVGAPCFQVGFGRGLLAALDFGRFRFVPARRLCRPAAGQPGGNFDWMPRVGEGMRALVYDPAARHGLSLGEAPDPVPGSGQALVRIAATSLNFGEVTYLSKIYQPGGVAGWDASGVVVAAAADGSGPAVGTRVVTFGWNGGWAQLRAVDTGELAALPDGIDDGAAAALPVAGVTALRALRRLGSVVGRRVLITGASGGVGRFAVQLAGRAGAHVIGAVGMPECGVGLAELGAAEVVSGGLADVREPVFGVIDNVGGPLLAEAYGLLVQGGLAVSVGKASMEPTTIDFEQMRNANAGARIEAFAVGAGVGPDLEYLASLVAAGRLDPQVGWRGGWERADEAAEALLTRTVAGKAILDVS